MCWVWLNTLLYHTIILCRAHSMSIYYVLVWIRSTRNKTCCQLCINDYICVEFDWIRYFTVWLICAELTPKMYAIFLVFCLSCQFLLFASDAMWLLIVHGRTDKTGASHSCKSISILTSVTGWIVRNVKLPFDSTVLPLTADILSVFYTGCGI